MDTAAHLCESLAGRKGGHEQTIRRIPKGAGGIGTASIIVIQHWEALITEEPGDITACPFCAGKVWPLVWKLEAACFKPDYRFIACGQGVSNVGSFEMASCERSSRKECFNYRTSPAPVFFECKIHKVAICKCMQLSCATLAPRVTVTCKCIAQDNRQSTSAGSTKTPKLSSQRSANSENAKSVLNVGKALEKGSSCDCASRTFDFKIVVPSLQHNSVPVWWTWTDAIITVPWTYALKCDV